MTSFKTLFAVVAATFALCGVRGEDVEDIWEDTLKDCTKNSPQATQDCATSIIAAVKPRALECEKSYCTCAKATWNSTESKCSYGNATSCEKRCNCAIDCLGDRVSCENKLIDDSSAACANKTIFDAISECYNAKVSTSCQAAANSSIPTDCAADVDFVKAVCSGSSFSPIGLVSFIATVAVLIFHQV